MSRTDQWIGLTNSGISFISKLLSDPKCKLIKKEYRLLVNLQESLTSQQFDGIYIEFADTTPNSTNEKYIIEEIIQENPWSGGPMYYTCLLYSCVKKLDNQKLELSKLYEWVHAYHLNNSKTEYDQDKGIIFV